VWGFFLLPCMKYSRLPQEELEHLYQEFSLFLATQSIDKKKWDQIKATDPQYTGRLLDDFSDMVWDDALDKILYLENRSNHHLFLFKCIDQKMNLILVRLSPDCPSLLQDQYWEWLRQHLNDDRVTLYESTRDFGDQIKNEKFKLIQKGANPCNGNTYEDLKSFLSK